ncbi:MAG TPA: HAD family phosphatase [Desulfobacterales bacterium]|nr:HAD family phosphatase [Desulfobacterales bacterium]
MTKLKLVIFDCDGVMFDSLEANRAYYNRILAHFGHPPMDDNELRFCHVHHVTDSIRHIFRNYPADYKAADSYRLGVEYTPFLKYMRIEPDLREFLDFLTPDIERAISTNRSNTMGTILEMFELSAYFTKVVTSQDVENAKPHPEALYQILQYFDLTAAECVYIGDSEIDVQHAAAVGMRMIAFKNERLKADYHVSSFMEISRLPIFS